MARNVLYDSFRHLRRKEVATSIKDASSTHIYGSQLKPGRVNQAVYPGHGKRDGGRAAARTAPDEEVWRARS